MTIVKDPNLEIELTKNRSMLGCLIWAVIILVGPILIFIGVSSYKIFFKETTLVTSDSPNGINTIEIDLSKYLLF